MDGCSYAKGLRSQLAGGVGLVVRLQITSRMLEGNVEYLNYLGSMITNNVRCTREIESRFAIAKAALNKNTFFTCKLDLNLRKKLANYCTWTKFCMVLTPGHFGT